MKYGATEILWNIFVIVSLVMILNLFNIQLRKVNVMDSFTLVFIKMIIELIKLGQCYNSVDLNNGKQSP